MIVITIIGILATMLLPHFGSAQDKAKGAAVKAVMHSLQISLESYCLEESSYPAGSQLTVADLYPILSENDHLTSLPKNPYTNNIYTASDAAGQIYYSYVQAENRYTLTGYGLKPDVPLLAISNL